jgi:hypothetical protein
MAKHFVFMMILALAACGPSQTTDNAQANAQGLAEGEALLAQDPNLANEAAAAEAADMATFGGNAAAGETNTTNAQ